MRYTGRSWHGIPCMLRKLVPTRLDFQMGNPAGPSELQSDRYHTNLSTTRDWNNRYNPSLWMVHLFYRQTTKSLEWPTMAKNRRQWPLSSAGRRYLYVRYPTSHLHLITSLDQVRSDTGDVQLCTTCVQFMRGTTSYVQCMEHTTVYHLCTIYERYNLPAKK